MVKLLDFVGAYEKIGKCFIATNGSIVPNDELMSVIKKNEISVRISDYGLFPEKIEAVINKCEEFGVKYRIYAFQSKLSLWYEKGGPEMKRTQDDDVVEERFKSCTARNCWTIENGEFCYCTRADQAYIYQNFDRQEDDYIKIENTPDFHDKLYKYLANPHAMEACRYCKGTTTENLVPPAIQM